MQVLFCEVCIERTGFMERFCHGTATQAYVLLPHTGNFAAMEGLGEPVMKPFLQDVIQFGPLLQTMGAQMVGGGQCGSAMHNLLNPPALAHMPT